LEYAVDRRGFDFGRDQHLDWTLPDKSRVVSGKHAEVRFYENAYWLQDTSTNGTFVNDSNKRVQSPYRLNNGDKLAIGEYIISVTIALAPGAAVQPPAAPEPAKTGLSPPPPPAGGSIWDTAGHAAPPIDPRELLPKKDMERAPDFLSQAAFIPPVIDDEPFRKPASANRPSTADVWGAPVEQQPAPLPLEAGLEPRRADQPALAIAPPASPEIRPAGPAPGAADNREVIRRFAQGAGVPEEVLARFDAGDLAELSGQLLNQTCQQLMALLHARAEAKALSRSGNHTMIQASDNNPLKFTPTPEEALRVMLGPRAKGYLDARQTLASTFADLKLHQVASLAAMQAAVTELFEELSPEAIAKLAESRKSLLGGGKGKQWDVFAEKWASKTSRHEHGMLGAFLDLFAQHYAKMTKTKG
jgi:type VI secretion system protein ImpI